MPPDRNRAALFFSRVRTAPHARTCTGRTTTSTWHQHHYHYILIMALQTSKQRASNAKFANLNVKKQGKPRAKKDKIVFPVSKPWLFALVFLVCGGAILEIMRIFF